VRLMIVVLTVLPSGLLSCDCLWLAFCATPGGTWPDYKILLPPRAGGPVSLAAALMFSFIPTAGRLRVPLAPWPQLRRPGRCPDSAMRIVASSPRSAFSTASASSESKACRSRFVACVTCSGTPVGSWGAASSAADRGVQFGTGFFE
jgi:hypothetical protein